MGPHSQAIEERRGQRTGQAQPVNFLRQFLKAPMSVGSPLASSGAMVRQLLDPLDWSAIKTVVEYGPGTGRFTEYVLERLPADGRLFTVDTDPAFTGHLRATLSDKRLVALTGCATRARIMLEERGIVAVDCIISGLPFSSLTEEDGGRIAADAARMLRPGGTFAAYQVRTTVEQHLRAYFPSVGKAYTLRNLLPCHLYWARHG